MKANLGKYSGMPDSDDKKYFYQTILRYAWEHNMNPDGSFMNPTQIANKGAEPGKIPQDLQDKYDKDKADYDKNKEKYDKASQDYKDRLDTFKGIQDLLLERQTLQSKIDGARNSGQDDSQLQDDMDELNDKIGDEYQKMSDKKDESSDGKPKDTSNPNIVKAVAPLRRQQAMAAGNSPSKTDVSNTVPLKLPVSSGY